MDLVECDDNASSNRYDGVCDKDGCDINPYRMGVEDFYGRGDQYAVNTLKPMTVVTQFLTTDGTDTGDFSEMRRLYIQDGKIVHSPPSTILGPGKESDSITDEFCDAKKDLFDNVKDYQEHGGMKGMGKVSNKSCSDSFVKCIAAVDMINSHVHIRFNFTCPSPLIGDMQ